jgi:hypothetical protein
MNENVPTMSREEQLDAIYKDIALAEAMTRLKSNPDFKAVFEEKFVKDYLLTQGYNLSVYNVDSRKVVLEHILARSIFQRFVDEVIDNGNLAVENKRELESEE